MSHFRLTCKTSSPFIPSSPLPTWDRWGRYDFVTFSINVQNIVPFYPIVAATNIARKSVVAGASRPFGSGKRASPSQMSASLPTTFVIISGVVSCLTLSFRRVRVPSPVVFFVFHSSLIHFLPPEVFARFGACMQAHIEHGDACDKNIVHPARILRRICDIEGRFEAFGMKDAQIGDIPRRY